MIARATEEDHGSQWREEWVAAQKLKGAGFTSPDCFQRNIEEELDLARKTGLGLPLHLPSHTMDFSSCDVLGMGTTGALREEFLKELADNPGFQLGAHGSRLMDGTTPYHVMVEKEMAAMMGVESALIVHSGWTANQAIWSTVPRSGDVLVYDELMHATALAGMKISLALEQKPFRHNDVEHFIEIMENIKDNFPQVKSGKKCVLIGVESYYSMDGDAAPLRELIDAAKEIFPLGNAKFIVDEAHSFGNMGPNGKGFVEEEGLADEVTIRMFTFGKALAGCGAAILSDNSVRTLLVNQAKVFICSVAPPFTLVAAARAGMRLMQTEEMQKSRDRLLYLTRYYLDTLTSNPMYKKANKKGLMKMPVHEDGDWHEAPVTHIVPLWCKNKAAHYLSFHLTRDGINGTPIVFPIVARGEDRVRLLLHAHNTEEDVQRLVNSICSFAEEMLEIESSGDKTRIPSAASLAFDLLKKEGQTI